MIRSSVFRIILIVLLAFGARVSSAQVQEVPLDSGLQGASDAGLLPMLNLVQTIDGAAVTLEYAYADSNRIAYRLRLRGSESDGILYSLGLVTVSDDAGHTFETMFGGGGGGGGYAGGSSGGGGGGGSPSAISAPSYAEASLDSAAISGMPDTINLRLETSVNESSMGGSGGDRGAPPTDEPLTPTPFAPKTIGPFVFNVTIPFIHGQVVEPKQSVTANGIMMRLNRLVVAPSLTRGLLCLDPASTKGSEPHLSLIVSGKAIGLGDMQQVFAPAPEGSSEGCYDLQINQSLTAYTGTWQLSMDSITSYVPVGYTVKISSNTWDYEFDGAPDALALVRTRLELALKPYDIPLTGADGNLQFSFPNDNKIDPNAIANLVAAATVTEIPGPWVFSFDVPPAP